MKLIPGTENNVETLLTVARLASSAGATVLAGRGSGRLDASADTKSAAGDWATDFDRGAEQAVRQVLSTFRPRDVLSGEEYPDAVPEEHSAYRWSIDPLDGTANFVRGLPHYATSVAVFGPGPDGAPAWLAGAVTAPVLGLVYYAAAGQGAFAAPWSVDHTEPQPGQPRRLTGPDPASDAPILASGFGYDPARRDFQAAALAALVPHFANVRRLGSAALDLCLVADGVLDAYAEFGTMEWDWAAGALIAQEAGAPVTRPVSGPGWQTAGAVDPAWLLQPGAN